MGRVIGSLTASLRDVVVDWKGESAHVQSQRLGLSQLRLKVLDLLIEAG